MNIRIQIGKYAEDVVCTFLETSGYIILKRNYRYQGGEIDIICQYKDTLVFVEVKCRTSDNSGSPYGSVKPSKLHKIIKTAYRFTLLHPQRYGTMRIDVISVNLLHNGSVQQLKHFKNVTE